MYYEKRYLQFNDLVFDGYDMISEFDEPLQYKGSSTPYSYRHGSYRAFKSDFLYVSERQVNMTITLKMKKIPCEYRRWYAQFAERELGKPGRLWAIKNNEIIWAIAAVNNIRPVNNGRQDEVVWDVEFVIPGGVWHKADKQKTFVLPYDVCTLMDCKGFENYDPCEQPCVDCCNKCIEKNSPHESRDRCDCCCGGDLKEYMSLCFHQQELQAFYGCDTPYQLVYDCEAAERFNKADAFGQKICAEHACDNSVISGRFYSETDIPTHDITVTLVGSFLNPWIKINGNVNVIEGEYHGKLIITPSGDVYSQPSDCCEPQLLDPSVWGIPKGYEYGWTVNPGINSIVVYTNSCCSQSGIPCVYIDHTAITT